MTGHVRWSGLEHLTVLVLMKKEHLAHNFPVRGYRGAGEYFKPIHKHRTRLKITLPALCRIGVLSLQRVREKNPKGIPGIRKISRSGVGDCWELQSLAVRISNFSPTPN
jgi:hypothetical protein